MVFLRVPSARRSDRFWQDAKICWAWGPCPQAQSPGGETPVPSSRRRGAKKGCRTAPQCPPAAAHPLTAANVQPPVQHPPYFSLYFTVFQGKITCFFPLLKGQKSNYHYKKAQCPAGHN